MRDTEARFPGYLYIPISVAILVDEMLYVYLPSPPTAAVGGRLVG